MQKFIQNKPGLWLASGLVIIGVLFYSQLSFLLQDRVLTTQIQSNLQKSLKQTGLNLKIKNVHWDGWGSFSCTRMVLTDSREKTIPFQAERVVFSFDILSLLKNRRHPESALRRVKLINPVVKLRRYADGTWDVRRYFPKSRGKLQLETLLTVKNGTILFTDGLYGYYSLTQVNGKARFYKDNTWEWDCSGISDINTDFHWKSRGYSELNFRTGRGEIAVSNLSLSKIATFVPPPSYPLKITKGVGKFDLKFGWHKNRLWLESGSTAISEARLEIPTTQEDLFIKDLEARISPAELKIKKANLVYNGALIKISGSLDTRTAAIAATVSGAQFRLEDLPKFFPKIRPYQIKGLANLKVKVDGVLDQPVLNGELAVTGARLTIAEYGMLENISGQTKIVDNDLAIKRMEGSFGKSLISIKGRILNIFKPSFDLEMSGTRLNLEKFNFPQFADLKIGPKIDFNGKISGGLWNPRITGEFLINELKYKKLRAEDLKVAVVWDSLTKSIQISKFEGRTWGGGFSAKGAVKISSDQVKWKVSGDIKNIDLAQTELGPEPGIKGRVTTNVILKGQWKQGEPFDPGIILGTFSGNNLANNEVFLDEVQGVFSWKENKLLIESVQACIGEGRIYGHLSFNNKIVTASFNAEHVMIRDLLVNEIKYPLDGVFEGSFLFEGPLSDISGKIDCSLTDTVWAAKKIGKITGILEYADQGLNITNLQVTSASGNYSVRGRINWAEGPIVALTMSSDDARLDGLSVWLPLDPDLRLSGVGSVNLEIFGPASNPYYAGEIYLLNPGIGDFQMKQGFVQLEGDFEEIRLNRMELFGNNSSVKISGKLNRENFDLYLVANQISLEMFNLEYRGKRLQGTINLEGKFVGKPGAPTFSAEFSSANLSYGPFSNYSISGAFDWKGKEIQFSRTKLSGDDCIMNIYGKIEITQPLSLDFGIIVSETDLRKILELFNTSGIAAEGKLQGFVKVTGDLDAPEIRIDGELTKAAISSVPVKGEFNLLYSNKKINIERVKFRHNSGSLTATGVWKTDAELELQIQSTDFPLEAFNTFLDPNFKLAGALDSDCVLVWSNAKIAGECRVDIDELYLNRSRLGDLQLRGKLSEQGFLITEGRLDTKGGLITAGGYLPWPLPLLSRFNLPVNHNELYRNLNLDLVFKKVPAEMINAYTQKVIISSGNVDGKLKLQGVYGRPVISGTLEADNIRATTSELPLPIENAQIIMEVQQNKVVIERVHGTYGDGRFALNGEAVLLFGKEDQLHFDLKFNGTNIYHRNNYFDGFADLNLQYHGTLTDSLLSGNVKVFNCRIGVLKLTKARTKDFALNPRFNLQVKAGKHVRYQQVGLADIAAKGSLNIGGSLKKPLLNGEVTSDKGVLSIYGQSFKVNNAKAVFEFSQGYKPYIEVDSSMITAQTEIFLTIKGQVGGNLSIKLYSYPYLSEADLFALMNWSELRGDRPLTVKGVTASNISMVTDTMFGEVFYELRRALHLDLLYLQHDIQHNELRISAGDFVTKKLFLSYSRSVSDDPKEEWGLEYHLTPKLITGGTHSLEEGIIWRLTYRFRF